MGLFDSIKNLFYNKPKTIEDLYAALPTSQQMKEIQNEKEQKILNTLKYKLLCDLIDAQKKGCLSSGWSSEIEVYHVSEENFKSFLPEFKKEIKEHGINYIKFNTTICTSLKGDISFRVKISI